MDNILKLKDIRKTYFQGEEPIEILKGIDLEIHEGEYVSIMGPSGSGKSTLMNIIGCLDQPTSGKYELDGEDLSCKSDDQLSDLRNHSIGFIFQNFHLMSRLNAVQNVELPLYYSKVPKEQRRQLAIEALESVGLGHRLTFHPAELSGGQKQRIAIARALVTNSKFILADEPTGALDSKTSEQIMDLLTGLNREGKTIIIITHESEVAAYTPRKIVLKDGVIA